MSAINHQFIYDADLELKDAGLVAASAAAQVDSTAKVLDLGEGFVEGNLIVDITAIEIGDENDQIYTIILEGSSSSTIASTIVPLAVLLVGANEVIVGGCDVDSIIGRYVIPFRNECVGTVYRYARLYTVVAGTLTTGEGINYSAWLAKSNV